MGTKSAIIVNQYKNKGEIALYGFIGQYAEITAAIFDRELTALEKIYDSIDLRMNCGGGSVYDGIAIYNRIKRSKITDVYNDGIVASMGSAIYMAGENRHMSKYARIMTHRCSGFAEGNADDMRANADEMDKIDSDLADMIAGATGITKEDAQSRYINSTDKYITSDTAKATGLVHSIYDGDNIQIPTVATTDRQVWEHYQAAITAKISNKNSTIIIL